MTSEEQQWFDHQLARGSYYYSFKRTGIVAVDRILGAVCAAGKGFHHTDQWCEEVFEDENGDIKISYRDLIQAAADDAARAWLAHDDKHHADDN